MYPYICIPIVNLIRIHLIVCIPFICFILDYFVIVLECVRTLCVLAGVCDYVLVFIQWNPRRVYLPKCLEDLPIFIDERAKNDSIVLYTQGCMLKSVPETT